MSDLKKPESTLLIKTFERPEALDRLLDSIQQYAPNHPVLIADDSQSPYKAKMLAKHGDLITEYVTLPFDTGKYESFNHLLDRVNTPYFVVNDDDFIYDERTDLDWMHQQLSSTDIELLGGLFYDRGSYKAGPDASIPARIWANVMRKMGRYQERIRRYQGRLLEEDTTLVMDPIEYKPPYTYCDYTHYFFMADTEAIREKVGGWRGEIKIRGHWEFFYRAKKAGLKVASTEEVGVAHRPIGSTRKYKRFRNDRGDHFERLALQMHGFTRKKWFATAMKPHRWREFEV